MSTDIDSRLLWTDQAVNRSKAPAFAQMDAIGSSIDDYDEIESISNLDFLLIC